MPELFFHDLSFPVVFFTGACSPLSVQFCFLILFTVVAITVSAFGCDTLVVSYTLNPLPGGGNEAILSSLEVSY